MSLVKMKPVYNGTYIRKIHTSTDASLKSVIYRVSPLSYLKLTSDTPFTVGSTANLVRWDGTIEYSTDLISWNEWLGKVVDSSPEGIIYLRGTNNTTIFGRAKHSFLFDGSTNLTIDGVLDTLLDYKSVEKGLIPHMEDLAFRYVFEDCTSLIKAPEFIKRPLSSSCYESMFYGCTSLLSMPILPSTELYDYCYRGMFEGCTSLENVHELPASELKAGSYNNMFKGCTSIVDFPHITISKLASSSLRGMFQGCTSLVNTIKLSKIDIPSACCDSMYLGCSSLEIAEDIDVNLVDEQSFTRMFQGCTSLIKTPSITSLNTESYTFSNMFYGCTSLTEISEISVGNLASYGCFSYMFQGCISLKTMPVFTILSFESESCAGLMLNCTALDASPTEDAEHTIPYRIPTVGNASTELLWNENMLSGTAGSQSMGINSTYYLKP